MQCAQKSNKSLSRKSWVLSSSESGCGFPFPPQDSVVRVNLSHLSHNTRIPRARISITWELLDRGWSHYGPQAKPVFISKVSLKLGRAHSFTHELWIFMLQLQYWVVVVKTAWSTVSKLFTVWFFGENIVPTALDYCCPRELSAKMKMLYVCAIHYHSHQHLKCG